ncbi:hypothetical protein H5410_026910 [Solanum commersonii]|uniref:Uncharacterized protein n=1 Tax=Solanum commersonii TaxID=4109 RepID=A0A9J5YYD8_SOLCO|nr:hypothetical protein H5410_026910 [Solanum commersonii]
MEITLVAISPISQMIQKLTVTTPSQKKTTLKVVIIVESLGTYRIITDFERTPQKNKRKVVSREWITQKEQ